MRAVGWLLVVFLVTMAKASAAPDTIFGGFYVSVDDHATIFVNGKQVYHADFGDTRSPNLELALGDHIVVHLKNDIGPRHLRLVFTSSDGHTVISFRGSDWKIIPDTGWRSFTDQEFAKWTKRAKIVKGGGRHLPVRGSSDAVWGDLDSCQIGCIITAQMVQRRP